MTTLLSDTDVPASPVPVIAIERLKWVGPLTIATSLAAVHATRLAALSVIALPPGPIPIPLAWIAPTADTVILCGLAVLVFVMVAGFADDPVRAWQRVALGALLVSFIPVLSIARGVMAGNGSVAGALAAMHIAAYIPCVTLLPQLTAVKGTGPSASETTT